ncbi:Uu.00g121820.m01.CDS01 [Anthostomella pinea]|uniref:Uu.00g121820.m01.CDS01 n=1 Tax=Anthostomella pinea TaxID=933095 RepID=A0AAI8VH44_9PEZI|nr:Uu.00g121820.m01.CDS01 [Anthostomella pinea]
MDPLSVSASIIAVATLAGQVCTVIAELRSICKSLPGRLHAVNNEVADLELVLSQMSLIIRNRSCLAESNASTIPHLLLQARAKLSEIEAIVRRLTAINASSRYPLAGASAWRKEQGALQILQGDLRTIKCSLNIMLGASNSQDMMRIRLDIQTISSVTAKSSQEQLVISDKFLTTLAGVDDRIARVEDILQKQSEQLQASQLIQGQSTYSEPATQAPRFQPTGRHILASSDKEDDFGVRVTPYLAGCASSCRCSCHCSQKSSTPSILNGLIGRLFIGYAGLSIISSKPIAANDNSPRMKACHFLLEGGLADTAVDALRAITKGSEYLRDFIDDSNFTQAHRIVLGLSMQNLEKSLLLSPQDVNQQDAMGRTALAWAAARGDARSVVTLLSTVRTQTSQTYNLQFLLDAGADPDPVAPDGVKRGSPLNVAARNAKDPLLVKKLLDFGAHVDQSSVDGKTALIHAAKNNNASLTMLLLEHGAKVNATSISGDTPLTTAITHNSHGGAEFAKSIGTLCRLRHNADLANTEHFRSRKDKRYTLGDFKDNLRQRPDVTDKLVLAFDELLSIFNEAPVPGQDPEGLLDAGFFKSLSRKLKFDEGFARETCSDEESDDSFHDAQDYVQVGHAERSRAESRVYIAFGLAIKAARALITGKKNGLSLHEHVAYAGIRDYQSGLSAVAIQNLLPLTSKVCLRFAKKHALPFETVSLPDATIALRIGPPNAKKAVVFFHGGGYMAPALSEHASFATGYGTCTTPDVAVYVLQYGLASETANHYPRQLQQAVHLMRHLLVTQQMSPGSITLVGDSAGAHLLLGLLLHLTHPNPLVPQLKLDSPLSGAVLVSPWVRLQSTAGSLNANGQKDVLSAASLAYWAKNFLGDRELLFDDAQEVCDVLRRHYADTTALKFEGELHGHMIMNRFLYIRAPCESEKAYVKWLDDHLNQQSYTLD